MTEINKAHLQLLSARILKELCRQKQTLKVTGKKQDFIQRLVSVHFTYQELPFETLKEIANKMQITETRDKHDTIAALIKTVKKQQANNKTYRIEVCSFESIFGDEANQAYTKEVNEMGGLMVENQEYWKKYWGDYDPSPVD